MAIYVILTYDVTDPKRYSKYVPGSASIIFETIAKHEGLVLFADDEAEYMEGESKMMNVGIRFPSKEAFHSWENDSEYADAKAHRLASSSNYTTFIVKENPLT